MKILHICQWDDTDTGGAVRVCEALVCEQRAMGDEAWILFLYGAPGHLHETLSSFAIYLGLNSSRQAFPGFFALEKAISRIAPDIIHSHDGILWPRLVYLRYEIPVVTHAHAPPGNVRKLKERLGWPLVKATTDCLIGVSWHTIDTWKKAGCHSTHIHMIPNGVDAVRFDCVDEPLKRRLKGELGLAEGKRVLLWVGRLHNDTKGTDRVEQVAALLPEDTILVVVGSGPEHQGMLHRCQPEIESARLVMAGSTPFPENYYKVADYYLFTSYQDAFGLVILEAVACQLPILAFPVTKGGGAVEVLREFNAIQLNDGCSSADLREALTIADRLKPSARILREKVISSYGWNALARKTKDVYGAVIGQVADGKSMTIVHICQRDDPETGGALRVAEALVREQLRSGVDAWMLFLYGAPGNLAKEFPRNTAYIELTSSGQVFSGLRKFRSAIKRIDPDLIHSHDGILWPRFAYLGCSVPVVTHAHASPGDRKDLKGRVGWPLVKMTTDRLIGISRHTSDAWLKAGYSGEITLIPNGVDLARFSIPKESEKMALRKQLRLPLDARIILWVGRLHRAMKGTDRVEHVAAVLPKDTVLVVVGDGPDYENMCRCGQASISEGRLIMVGSTFNPSDYYRAADLYLFTSYHEPFGLVILEAVASGLPLVAFPVTEGGGGAALLEEFEATMLEDGASAAAIGAALDAGVAKRADSVRLRKRAEEAYAWPSVSQTVVKVYEELLIGRGESQ